MSKISKPKDGEEVLIKFRSIKFSFWPMYKSNRRYGLQTSLFVQNPWTMISSSVVKRCAPASLDEALAYVEQAQDFYLAASSERIVAAKPLLLYYCFMNIAKAYILATKHLLTVGQAHHGISERLGSGNRELIDAYLDAYKSSLGKVNLFDKFALSIQGSGLSVNRARYDILNLLPQVVAGHRLWAKASKSFERFLPIEKIEFCENKKEKKIWFKLFFYDDDLSRFEVTHRRLLEEGRMAGDFREVTCDKVVAGRKLLCFEQKSSLPYSDMAADKIQELVSKFRKNIWAVATSLPPNRKYYVYLAPLSESSQVMPQLLSIYAVMYYLGSITRYRPHHFDKIIKSDHGSFVEEFISSQPTQFIYLIASEFAQQEVIKPAII